ncbi:TPA: GtrA family protein [Citrobacter amalonaticus]|nr:GtrA family protein [Citrobacter amalonaticus]
MLKLFAKYTSIGVINTLIHWVVFAFSYYSMHASQTLANLSGFIFAVSFSFFVNARFTFRSRVSTLRYLLYAGFMGALSACVGWIGDTISTPPMLTVLAFSATSLVFGFLYAKFIVFNDR